ncbi:hypothetical protein L596_012769 [Steinernema carpocapsae]|uniref:Uncharacterized protein n=1 Tax=Steinernema carpocapsae TaxID=34508 RepID=A0A4U5NZ17_STECR|nr:hypothetical protein L596_012769 [Steinernema carpocapsae]
MEATKECTLRVFQTSKTPTRNLKSVFGMPCDLLSYQPDSLIDASYLHTFNLPIRPTTSQPLIIFKNVPEKPLETPLFMSLYPLDAPTPFARRRRST